MPVMRSEGVAQSLVGDNKQRKIMAKIKGLISAKEAEENHYIKEHNSFKMQSIKESILHEINRREHI